MSVSESDRRVWMGLLARAPEGRVTGLLAATALGGDASYLRPPEVGSVMVRGRAGGTGAPFNLGEMTITRCAVKLSSGVVGHGHVQGRRKEDAHAAALIDALMQTDRAGQVEASILAPLRDEETARRSQRAEKAAATKVDFFTMVRGED